MAKKSLNGNKIKRGANNPALTPGGDVKQNGLEEILGSAVDKIIQRLEDNEDVMSDIYSEISGLHKWSSKDAIDNLTWHLNDKMTAVLGALYGTTQATPDMTSSQWLSKLGKPQPGKEIYAGIISELENVGKTILESINGLQSHDAKETNNALGDTSDVINSVNIVVEAIDGMNLMLNEKLTAMLSALYGISQASVDMSLSQWVSHLGKPQPKKEIYSGLLSELTAIRKIVNKLNGSSTSAITNDDTMDAVVHRIEIDAQGIDTDTLSALLDISKEGIVGKFDINQLVDDISKFSEGTLKGVVKNIDYLNIIFDGEHMQGVVRNIEALGNLKGAQDNIKLTIDLLKLVGNIDNTIGFMTMMSIGVKSSICLEIVEIIKDVIKHLSKVSGIKSSKRNVEDIGSLINDIASLDNGSLDKMINVISAISETNNRLIVIALTSKIASLGASSIEQTLQGVADAVKIINDFNNIDEANKKIDDIYDVINGLSTASAALASISITGPFAIIGAGMLLLNMKLIEKIVGKVNNIEINEDTEKNAKAISILIAACGGIMLVGALVGTYVAANLGSYVIFTVALSTFIFGVIGALNIATRGMEPAQENAEEFAKLLAISGGIMLIGGTIMTMFPQLVFGSLLFAVSLSAFIFSVVGTYSFVSRLDFKKMSKSLHDLGVLVAGTAAVMLIGGTLFAMHPWLIGGTTLFGVVLAAFVGGTAFIFANLGDQIKEATNNAEQFAKLIAISASTLVIGGALLLFNPHLIWAIPLFGVLLTAFIAGVTFVYNKLGSGISEATEHAKEFGILIALSASSLIIGGWAIQKNPHLIWSIPVFGVLLAGFVAAIAFVYGWASRLLQGNGMDVAREFQILVGISAATLLIGGAFMLIPGMPGAVAEFGVTLALFVAAIGGIYWGFSKIAKTVIPSAYALSALVAISAATLLVGGMMIINNEGLLEASVLFAVTTVAFVGAFAAMVWGLSKIPLKDLAAGIISLALITLIIDSFVGTFKKVNELSQVIDKDKIYDTMLAMLTLVGGTGVLVGILAGVYAIPGVGLIGIGLVAAAEATLAGLVKIIDITADAMIKVARASSAMAHIEIPDIGAVTEAIGKMLLITGEMSNLANPAILLTMQAAKVNTMALASCISVIGKSVRDFSSLVIPEYDENGKISGYRRLTQNDFDNAAEHIKAIVSTLGNAVIEAYNENPDIFGSGFGGAVASFFGIDTPFGRTAKSCAMLGTMISKIAEGVRDYANFRIKTYDENGKVIGTRGFTDADFDAAGRNISTILTTLGYAVIKTYNENPGMFADQNEWWQPGVRTPFGMVAKSLGGIGKLISSVASGIKDYADLRMPIYDENGKVIGYRTMEDADFKAAGEGISKVLKAIAGAIINVYNDPANKNMFDASASLLRDIVGNDFGDNPFVIVRKSFEGTGKLISEAVKAINEVNKLDVNVDDAKKKIANVISALGAGIMEVYNDPANKDMFDASASLWSLVAGKSAEDTPFVIVKKSLEGTGDLIKKAALAIKEVMAINLGNNPEAKVKRIISMLPAAFSDEAIQDIDPDDANEIVIGLKSYCTATNELVKAYTSIWKLISNASSADGAIVDTLGSGLVKMMSYLNSSISVLYSNGQDESTIKARMDSFAAIMTVYNDSIKSLASAFKLIPEDYSKYDNLNAILTDINAEIGNVPDLTQFANETKLLDDYVKTINSLNTEKVDSLSNLADSLSEMSTKLGSLDKLTDVLANKVAVVMTSVVTSIDKSASIIQTADKLQKDRHKQINESINRLKTLLEKPLNVTVTHRPEDPGLPSNGGGGDSSMPTNAGTTSSPMTPASTPTNTAKSMRDISDATTNNQRQMSRQQSGNGITERQARDISHDEAIKVLQDWAARNRDYVGGGKKTGAQTS